MKAQARRAVHELAAVPASYIDSTLAEPVAVAVRWHNKVTRLEVGDSGDYADVLASVDRLVFSADELAAKTLTLRRNGTVTITKYGAVFKLDHPQSPDGPHNVYWGVAYVST